MWFANNYSCGIARNNLRGIDQMASAMLAPIAFVHSAIAAPVAETLQGHRHLTGAG